MYKASTPPPSAAAGFTLIELMITIVVATILLTIAIPSYQSQMRKSRRTEIKTALLDLAAREERYMSTNSGYTADPVQLGYAAGTQFPLTLPSGYYQIAAPVLGVATDQLAATYSFTATAINIQAADTTCATFTLDSKGQQGGTTATCWN